MDLPFGRQLRLVARSRASVPARQAALAEIASFVDQA